MSLYPGMELKNLLITDLTVRGQSVARHEGRVVFLDDGLPGEVVDARVLSLKKNLAQARVERIASPSPDRVRPCCPYYDDCGGCLWRHYALEAQLRWKQNHVRETLARIGGVRDIVVHPPCPSPRGHGFRNKMTYAFAPDPGAGRICLGLRRQRSHSVVEVESCAVLPPEISAVANRARSLINERAASPEAVRVLGEYLRFLVLRSPELVPDGGQRLVLAECITTPRHERLYDQVRSCRDLVEDLASALYDEEALVAGFIHSERKSPELVARGEGLVGSRGRTDSAEGYAGLVLASVPLDCFMQTNTGAAERLYALIREQAGLDKEQVLWDLFSGTGAIALYLAGDAREAHGFESSARAVEAARINARQAGLAHCHFHVCDLAREQSLPALPLPDVVVLDPPRAGLGRDLTDNLLSLPARRLLYVSCDAGALARDSALLRERWEPVACYPVDMFPHTPHVETLLVMQRR